MNRWLVATLCLVVLGCGTPSGTDGGTGGGGATGGGTTGGGTTGGGGGGTTGGGTGGGTTGGGTGGGGGGGVQVFASTACPHVDLGSTTSVTYMGNTTGLPNWVESNRLEWRTDPDDTLVFTAPSAGTYRFTLVDSTTTNGGMGVSIREANQAFFVGCPSAGSVLNVDGFFDTDVPLTANQRITFFVSAAYWAMPMRAGAYTLTIAKQ